MLIPLEVDNATCDHCGIMAAPQVMRIQALPGGGGFQVVQMLRPVGWKASPTSGEDPQRGLCRGCSALADEAITQFLAAKPEIPKVPRIEEPAQEPAEEKPSTLLQEYGLKPPVIQGRVVRHQPSTHSSVPSIGSGSHRSFSQNNNLVQANPVRVQIDRPIPNVAEAPGSQRITSLPNK